MKALGIDYGAKRVGIALSDDGMTLAFPHKIFSNDGNLVSAIREIIETEDVRTIVLGKSLNNNGGKNEISEAIENFRVLLHHEFQLPIIYEREWFTSLEGERYVKNEHPSDDRAAAIILQRYLDKFNFKK